MKEYQNSNEEPYIEFKMVQATTFAPIGRLAVEQYLVEGMLT